MIRCNFKIGDSKEIVDTYDKYRFVYVESDDTLHKDIVAQEETSYANEHGSHSSRKFVTTGFEYKIKFLVIAHNREGDRVNTWVRKFINDIHDKDELKDITFYNAYKRVMVRGQLKDIAYSDFYRHKGIDDSVIVEMTLIVRDPKDCNFDYFVTGQSGKPSKAPGKGNSCFSQGYWVNELPWNNDLGWIN